MIDWFARNHVAANLLMAGILLLGIVAVKKDIALELLPDFQLGIVNVVTLLPGGNPQTIESTITSRIEEAIADIEGIKKINSRSTESFSNVFVEIQAGYNDLDIQFIIRYHFGSARSSITSRRHNSGWRDSGAKPRNLSRSSAQHFTPIQFIYCGYRRRNTAQFS